jgi:hypothetical protein
MMEVLASGDRMLRLATSLAVMLVLSTGTWCGAIAQSPVLTSPPCFGGRAHDLAIVTGRAMRRPAARTKRRAM